MTKPATKQGMIFEVMDANADKPMEEVIQLILALKGVPGKELTHSDVRSTYLWAIRTGKAKGVGKPEGSTRAKSTRTPKAPKADKGPKLIKVPKPRVAGDKPKITDKTVEEIADIRAKNLARLRSVGRKYAKGQYAEGASGREHTDEEARDVVAQMEQELDSFKAPRFLNMDQVKALV